MTAILDDLQPTATDLVRAVRRFPGAMATTWDLANALEIPEAEVCALTAQARDLGLIATERDPRTLSPMHRLTEAGRRHGGPLAYAELATANRRRFLDRRPATLAAIDTAPSAVPAHSTTARRRVRTGRAYAEHVLGHGPRPDIPAAA